MVQRQIVRRGVRDALSDWMQAERELAGRARATPPAAAPRGEVLMEGDLD